MRRPFSWCSPSRGGHRRHDGGQQLSAIMIATIFFFNAVVPLLFSKTDKHLFGNYNMKTIHQIKLIVNIL